MRSHHARLVDCCFFCLMPIWFLIPKTQSFLTQAEDVFPLWSQGDWHIFLVPILGSWPLFLETRCKCWVPGDGLAESRVRNAATHCGNRRFTGSLTVEDVLIPQWPRIGGKKVPCCCWLRLCPAPEGVTQALQPACLSRTEIFRAVKNRICGFGYSDS